MRTSTYEIFLPLIGTDEKPIEGYALLYNGLYGALDVVTQEERDIIEAGELAKLPSPVSKRLSLRGHITRKPEEEEIADMRLLSRIHRAIPAWNRAWLVIMPTYDCNFRCPYCYEQHRLKKGEAWLSSVMNDETIDAIFVAVDDHKARGFSFASCVLYGGEPFLKKNREVVGRIADKCKARGIKIQAITNGYDLDAFLDCIEEYRFDYLQITVDGTADINDCRRLHKNGLPTYDRILNNVELALSRGVDIRLRVNVGRDNLHGIGALISDLKARGFIEKEETRAKEEKKLKEKDKKVKTGRGHFHYFFKAAYDDAHPEKNVSERDIIDELMKIGFTAGEAISLERQYIQFAERLSGLLGKESFPEFSPVYCYAERGLVVVDPFGKAYSCFDSVAIEENSVGYVDKDLGRFLWNFNKAKWRVRTVDNMEPCRTCPYALCCGGGCAFRANHEHGSYFREHCGEIREIVAFVASHMVGKEWEKNHNKAMGLSLAEPLSRLTAAERETIMMTKSHKEIFKIVQALGLLPGGNKSY